VGKAAHLVLVGIPGSGKTTTGRELARLLVWPFLDLDEQIAERAGMSVRDIFARLGEPRFRAMEREETSAWRTSRHPWSWLRGAAGSPFPGL
jgi:shikimate kinase